jgi:hypothetical protein
MSSKKSMKKSEQPKVSAAKTAPVKVPSLKKLIKYVLGGEGPRGLKVAKNEAGGYTFSYGPKSSPVSIVASTDEVVALLLASVGLKLS